MTCTAFMVAVQKTLVHTQITYGTLIFNCSNLKYLSWIYSHAKLKKWISPPQPFLEHFLFSHFYYCKRAEVFILNSWVCISHNKILLIAESTPLHHRVSSCLRKATGFIHPLLSPGLFALYWGEKPLHNWLLCALCLRHLPIAAVGSIPPAELGPWGFWPKHKGHLFSFPSPWPMTQDEP